MSNQVEGAAELDGVRWKYIKRVVPGLGENGDLTGVTQYSFDAGATWHPTMIEAFNKAKESGLLLQEGEENDGETEAFILSLLSELKELKPGECLKVHRDENAFVVLKESAVLSTRASTLGDIDFKLEGNKNGRR